MLDLLGRGEARVLKGKCLRQRALPLVERLIARLLLTGPAHDGLVDKERDLNGKGSPSGVPALLDVQGSVEEDPRRDARVEEAKIAAVLGRVVALEGVEFGLCAAVEGDGHPDAGRNDVRGAVHGVADCVS